MQRTQLEWMNILKEFLTRDPIRGSFNVSVSQFEQPNRSILVLIWSAYYTRPRQIWQDKVFFKLIHGKCEVESMIDRNS